MASRRRSMAIAISALGTILVIGLLSEVGGGTAWAISPTVNASLTQPANPYLPGVTPGPAPTHGVDQQYRRSLVVDGRTVDVFVPGDRRISSLVGLQHPLSNTAIDIETSTARLISYGLEYRYLMFYPRSTTGAWNAGGCCGVAKTSHEDDVAFLEHIIKFLRVEYRLGADVPTIDGGISNGAMMAAELYCKRPGLLDGAVLASGNLQDATCGYVARVQNLLMLRGDRDGTVPIGDRRRLEPLQTYYNYGLKTTMYPDASTINADERGSRCTEVVHTSIGVIDRVIRCGGRRINYVEQQRGGHGWHSIAGPGTVDESSRAAGFINDISLRLRRAFAAAHAG